MAKWNDVCGITTDTEVSYDIGDLVRIDENIYIITDEVSISAMAMETKGRNFHRKATYHDVTGYRIHSCDSEDIYDAVLVPSVEYYDEGFSELCLDATYGYIFDEKHIGEDGFVFFDKELYPIKKETIEKAKENGLNLVKGLVPTGGADEKNYKLLLEHIIIKAKNDSYNYHQLPEEIKKLTAG